MKKAVYRLLAPLLAIVSAQPCWAVEDLAAIFGARNAIEDIAMSPDGSKIAFITPGTGQSSTLFTVEAAEGAQPRKILSASGNPERFSWCNWVANDRLACAIYGTSRVGGEVYSFSRILATNVDGTNTKLLSSRDKDGGIAFGGGYIVDWLPDEDGVVLMQRNRVGDSVVAEIGVDRLDTRTLTTKKIEEPRSLSTEYYSDGRGTIRIMGVRHWADSNYNLSPIIVYMYRKKGSRTWERLAELDTQSDTGFNPIRIDYDRDIVYGLMKRNGRQAAYEMALDGSFKQTLVYERADVDIDGFATIGRRNRVIGVNYATDYGHTQYLDANIQKLEASLSKALPDHPAIDIIDSNTDESKLLVRASSDRNPGVYYMFDKQAKRLVQLLEVQPSMAGRTLAAMQPITYTTKDGTRVPAYLTLPPGSSGKGLPAIVMPHGGPEARDRWDFDWLPQFFAARGFAVIQPQYRGSAGYGDDWLQKNAYRSWGTAISDVLDAGRWLVKEGIADPKHLAIVGWSYGGYAALQSAVVDASLFKAVVAIAPVTDLVLLKNESRNSIYAKIQNERIGSGAYLLEGSPAQHAESIRVPVILFHGENDLNVDIKHSRIMAARLKAANVPSELVTWPLLDHQLFDSTARADMLRKSDAFLRKSMGMPSN